MDDFKLREQISILFEFLKYVKMQDDLESNITNMINYILEVYYDEFNSNININLKVIDKKVRRRVRKIESNTNYKFDIWNRKNKIAKFFIYKE